MSQAMTLIAAATVFVAGFGWGMWVAEMRIRENAAEVGKYRMQVSMPMNPEDAAVTLELLSALVKKAELKQKGVMK